MFTSVQLLFNKFKYAQVKIHNQVFEALVQHHAARDGLADLVHDHTLYNTSGLANRYQYARENPHWEHAYRTVQGCDATGEEANRRIIRTAGKTVSPEGWQRMACLQSAVPDVTSNSLSNSSTGAHDTNRSTAEG